MAVIQSGEGTELLTVDPGSNAGRVTLRPSIAEAYSTGAASGLIASVNANDVLFAFRWGSALKNAVVWRVRAQLVVVSGFTAAQEIGVDLTRARTYTASHTGGTPLVFTGNNAKRKTGSAASLVSDARVSTTGALGGGTLVLDDSPIAFAGAYALAAAATVQNPVISLDKNFVADGSPLLLSQDEGLIIRNRVSMGAGGTARLYVELDWFEVGVTDVW